MIFRLDVAVPAAAFLFGAVPSLFSIFTPALAEILKIDKQRAGWLTIVFFGGCVVTMPAVGALVDAKSDGIIFLILGAILMCGALGFLAQTRKLWLALLVALTLSFAFASFALGTLYLMPRTLGSKAPEAMNLGFIPVALGALTAHVIFPFFEKRFGFRKTVTGLGVLFLIPGLLALFAPDPRSAATAAAATAPLERWQFWLILVMMFCYFCVESIVEVWTEPYLKTSRFHVRLNETIFWLSFLAGRFLIYRLHVQNEWIYLVAAIGMAVTLGNLSGVFGMNRGGLFGLHIAGFCMGPLLPGFLGVICQAHPDKQGLVMGAVLAMNGLNHSLVEPLLGKYAEKQPAHKVFQFAMYFSLAMGVLYLFEWMREKF